jgi:hypothetical protein
MIQDQEFYNRIKSSIDHTKSSYFDVFREIDCFYFGDYFYDYYAPHNKNALFQFYDNKLITISGYTYTSDEILATIFQK